MDTSVFIKKSKELCDTLERFCITRSRLCAVTLCSGDGICVSFDRSDRSSASLHQHVKNAFPDDFVILSYEPTNPAYKALPCIADNILEDPTSLAKSSVKLKEHLYRFSEEKHLSRADDVLFHVIYTSHGVCVGAHDMEKLEYSVFRLEQYIRKLAALDSIRKKAIAYADRRASVMSESLRRMDEGTLYIKETKSK